MAKIQLGSNQKLGGTFTLSGSPTPLVVFDMQEYDEDQFHADIRKASAPLEAMAAKARKNLKAGKARKFPA